jgi:hypothetical protein
MTLPRATHVPVDHRVAAPAGPSLIFSMLFAVTYALSFYFNWPLFAYYPQVNEFHVRADLQNQLGPPILWYGWLATAAIVSAVPAAIIPRGVVGRLWPGLAWAVPGAVIVAILIYEKRWFF